MERALTTINSIRDSIVGTQAVNWSEHIHPLVAALDGAGYEGLSYPEARGRVATLQERVTDLERELDGAKRMNGVLQVVSGAVITSMMESPDEKDAHIARLQREKEDALLQVEELQPCGFVIGSERPSISNSYLGDVDVCENVRPCAEHTPEAWITEVNRREALEEALELAESERLMDGAIDRLEVDIAKEIRLHLDHRHDREPFDCDISRIIGDYIRAARGVKENLNA